MKGIMKGLCSRSGICKHEWTDWRQRSGVPDCWARTCQRCHKIELSFSDCLAGAIVAERAAANAQLNSGALRD